jgi:hypothetical protein
VTRRKKRLMSDQERRDAARGNTTCGADRRGNKGRPAAYPADVVTWSWRLTLSDEQCRKAKALGDGNLAAGVRIALDRTPAPSRYEKAPPDMLGFVNWLAVQKASRGTWRERYIPPYIEEHEEQTDEEDQAQHVRDFNDNSRPAILDNDMFDEIEGDDND